jgi:predicted transglutaminase-like cysteine proteinase
MWSKMQRILLFLLLFRLALAPLVSVAEPLFGYQETAKRNLGLFPQWLSVLKRHVRDMSQKIDCSSGDIKQCRMEEWLEFLDKTKNMTEINKIRQVNEYVNQRPYILDIENYGIEDYWAAPKEFLNLYGDCEDYAITKMLSLERLGLDASKMRVVVVQDTNLRIPHAVMSIDRGKDILILDNQIKQVISHKYIYHYTPVYSINEKSWWMHLPN